MKHFIVTLLVGFWLMGPHAFADVNAKNGISITTASTINGKTPNAAFNGIIISGGSVTFTDDFESGPQFPLSGGGNWTATGLGSWSDVYQLSGGALGTDSGAIDDGLAMVNTSAGAFPANQSCTITLRTGYEAFCGPATRVSAGGDCYYLFYDGSTGYVVRKSDGTTSGTQVGSTVTASSPSGGDQLTLECTGTSTVTLNVKLNGSLVGSVSDTSGTITSGQPGIRIGNGFYIEAMSAIGL